MAANDTGKGGREPQATGRARARAQSRRKKAGLPPSVTAQAQAAVDELSRIQYMREACDLRQGARGHTADQPYSPAEDGGEILSYDEYREFLDRYEARARTMITPAAMKIAERIIKQRDQEAERGGG